VDIKTGDKPRLHQRHAPCGIFRAFLASVRGGITPRMETSTPQSRDANAPSIISYRCRRDEVKKKKDTFSQCWSKKIGDKAVSRIPVPVNRRNSKISPVH